MLRLALKTLLAQRRRLASSVLSVILGIAFLAGTFVFTDSLRANFDDLFATVYSHTDAVVRSSQEIEAGQGLSLRGRISDDLVEVVARVPGVRSADGSASGYGRILGKDGEPLGIEQGAPTVGASVSELDLTVWNLKEGRLPRGGTEVTIDAKSATDGGYQLGDRVTVIGQTGPRTFTLVGVVRFGTVDSPAGATFALFDLDTAQSFVGQKSQIDAISVYGDGTVSPETLAQRVRAALPAGTETLTGEEMAADSSNQIKQALGFFNTLLLVFAFIALFVGSFIIYNTFTIIVAQRTKDNALLRAIGASRRQVMGDLLMESFVMGVFGAAVGFVAGIAMSSALKGFLAAIGIDVPTGPLVLRARTAIVSLLVGIVITIASAVLPARRGSRVAPVAAMRDAAIERRSFSRRRPIMGGALLLLAVAAIGIGLTGELEILGLGVTALFVSLFVLGPMIARPLSEVIGAPIAKLRGVPGTVARQNAMRNPKRTAGTAAALLVSVALVATITVTASSIKASVRDIIGEQFTGDFVVATRSFGFGGLPLRVATEIAALPEVEAATGVQLGLATVDGSNQALSVIDPVTAPKVFDLRFTAGSAAVLNGDTIAVSRKRADDKGYRLGTELRVGFLNGTTRVVRVAGIYEKDELAGAYSIAKSMYAQSGADLFDFSVYVLKRGGVGDAKARAAIAGVADRYPTAKLQSRTEYVKAQAAQIDTFVNLIYGLLGLAVVIAILGITNTLSLSVHERTREIGLLRAVGATRKQVRAMVRWEAVITAVMGGLEGIVVGVGLGYAVVVALRDQGFRSFSLPIAQLGVVLVIAVVCGIVAAARPARRAARLDVLRAISK